MDSNKSVVRATLGVLYELALAIKKPFFEKNVKYFYSTVLQILGDGNKQNRDDALRCARAFADNSQLSTTLSASASALVGDKDSPVLRREVLTFLNERITVAAFQEFSSAGDGLQAIIRPALACALDKQGDVRKLAETTLSVVAKHVSYSSFELHLEKYPSSQKETLSSILDRFYNPTPKKPASGSASPSVLPRSVKRSPIKPSVSQRITSSPIKTSVSQRITSSPLKANSGQDPRSPAKRKAQGQGLLLVDSVQKAMRSKSKAFYDAKMLGSVAGRQTLRDYLRGELLADSSMSAQMFSQDPMVLAQTLADFITLVDKYPTSAANSSDLLIMWCVTVVMGDVTNGTVFDNSFSLLVNKNCYLA